jgi:hypothetical protein
MIIDCISMLCVLGLVVPGILIMIRAITLDQLLSGVGRFLFVVIGTLAGVCFLKTALVCIVAPLLQSVRAVLFWSALALLSIITLVLIARAAISKLKNWIAGYGNSKGTSHERD